MPLFTEWESFYVIVGSSAAALTGLQFVVMALIRDIEVRTTARAIDAFATPTIVHFCVALLVSAILTAPWHRVFGPLLLLAVLGVTGVVYSILVARRARQQTEYKPVFEDWAFHVLLPGAAYGVIAAAAFGLRVEGHAALFALAASVVILLFVGIHNAWDTVTYMLIVRRNHGE